MPKYSTGRGPQSIHNLLHGTAALSLNMAFLCYPWLCTSATTAEVDSLIASPRGSMLGRSIVDYIVLSCMDVQLSAL